MKTCIKIDVSKVCKDIKFETKKEENFNLGQNVSFSRIYSGSCMANYQLELSLASSQISLQPCQKAQKKRVTHDSQGCQKSSCHRFVSLGTKLLLLQMTRMNACYIYNVCHGRVFRRKPRPVNSVSYLILTRVVKISQHSVNFD